MPAPVWPDASDPASVIATAQRSAHVSGGKLREREWSTAVNSGPFLPGWSGDLTMSTLVGAASTPPLGFPLGEGEPTCDVPSMNAPYAAVIARDSQGNRLTH